MHENSKVILTSSVGNIAEQYDTALYGYFAAVFAKIFFPTGNLALATTLTFAIFAGGYLTRPLGGMLFGHIGDRYGRKKALLISIVLITLPTIGIGCLPGYQTIGIAAPIILAMLRLLQGIFLSGELAGSGVFLIESAPEKRRGLWGCLALFSTYIGFVLGALVSILVTNFMPDAVVHSYGWRIPFLLAAPLGLAATLTRIKCAESTIFNAVLKAKSFLRLPAITALREYPAFTFWVVILNAAGGVAFYLISGYFPTFFVQHLNLTLEQAMLLNGAILLMITLFIPLFGWLSDHMSRKTLLAAGAIGFIIFSHPIFVLLFASSIFKILLGALLLALCLALIAGTCITITTEILPIQVRYSVIALGYNLGMLLFGGTTPLIANWMIKWLHSNFAPALLLAASGLFTLVALAKMQPVDSLKIFKNQ